VSCDRLLLSFGPPWFHPHGKHMWSRLPGYWTHLLFPRSVVMEVRGYPTQTTWEDIGLRTDVARLLSGADLCLLTSVSEGIPLVLIEAMAAGLPVVSTGVGGVGEVVVDGQTGLLTPSGDSAALAGSILHLAADPARRGTMGRAGRERAEARFDERLMHAGYADLYDGMLGLAPRCLPAVSTVPVLEGSPTREGVPS
jgi:glycosyltransferase involved in cell wall biosynthesis